MPPSVDGTRWLGYPAASSHQKEKRKEKKKKEKKKKKYNMSMPDLIGHR
jgi:hypothetical protein